MTNQTFDIKNFDIGDIKIIRYEYNDNGTYYATDLSYRGKKLTDEQVDQLNDHKDFMKYLGELVEYETGILVDNPDEN